MRDLVLDPSVVLAWLLDDEYEPVADAVIESLAGDRAWVPQHWHFEVRNGLLMGERRGRLSRGQCNRCVGSLQALPVQTDNEADLDTALGLAREHGLTFYDALYLELARRRSARLATLDAALQQAAQAEGVQDG